jgi:hypothetical protein
MSRARKAVTAMVGEGFDTGQRRRRRKGIGSLRVELPMRPSRGIGLHGDAECLGCVHTPFKSTEPRNPARAGGQTPIDPSNRLVQETPMTRVQDQEQIEPETDRGWYSDAETTTFGDRVAGAREARE